MKSFSPIELALFVKYNHSNDGKCLPITSLNKNALTCTHCQLLWILPCWAISSNQHGTTERRADMWYVCNQLPQTGTNQNQHNIGLNYSWSHISGGNESRHINPCIPLLLFPSHWAVDIFAAAAAKSLQTCLTLCDPLDCSPSGSSVHRIFPGKSTGVVSLCLLLGYSCYLSLYVLNWLAGEARWIRTLPGAISQTWLFSETSDMYFNMYLIRLTLHWIYRLYIIISRIINLIMNNIQWAQAPSKIPRQQFRDEFRREVQTTIS